jgi:tRNA (guanine-N7-)-methyltransferase
MDVEHPRRIRSFVRRPGRITTGQKRALESLLPKYGIAYREARIDLDQVFGRSAPRVFDIGFGDGAALVTAAATFPAIDYLGAEVHEPGIGHLLVLLERSRLANVRLVDRDAVDVIEQMLPDASLDAVNLFFPDPWPKKRHHKRRIMQPQFLASVARILKPGGLLHFTTDWADYAVQARALLEASPDFRQVDNAAADNDPLAFRAPTRFEARGRRLGHEVVDFVYRRS